MPVIFFYLVFLGQIYLLSYHYPWKIYARIAYILDNFPPADYPKLYPASNYIDPALAARKSVKVLKTINILTILLGLGILLSGVMNGYSPAAAGEETFVVFFAMLQFVPILILEIRTYKQNKLMRELSKSKIRTANLQARRLFDYISPVFVVIAGISLCGVATFELYIADFEWLWDKKFNTMVGGAFAMNIFFSVLVYKAVKGQKPDPHLSFDDQQKVIKIVVSSAVFTSIGMSVFFIVQSAVRHYDLDYLDPVIISIYFQAIAVMGLGQAFRTLKIEDVNFDVYKKTEEIS